MDAPRDSEIITQILKTPSQALLRKFGSLGFLLLVRLQSEIAAIEAHSGETLKKRINLRRAGPAEVVMNSEVFTQDRQLEENLQRKLVNYYTLLHLFTKVQSFSTPHKVVLEGFTTTLERQFYRDIKDTTWFDKHDLMGPFTNYLPQWNLITTNIVNLFYKMRRSRWFGAFLDKFPKCIRRRYEHSEFSNGWTLKTKRISSWFSEIAVIIVPTIIVAPMFVLYAIPSTWARMAALWVFAVVFAIMTRLLAKHNTDFIFVTNAAFCAVLVVFVGSALSQ